MADRGRRGTFIWDTLNLRLDGRMISASYGYTDRFIAVQTTKGRKIAELGASDPKLLARKLLSELVNEKKH
jgi:hypothetical protein